MTGLQSGAKSPVSLRLSCILSSCKGIEYHLGFLGLKRCTRVQVLSCASLKREGKSCKSGSLFGGFGGMKGIGRCGRGDLSALPIG